MNETTAASVVQAQLDAYNARDIEAFMACWAATCRYYAFPNDLLAAGADEVRARHVGRFREPDLHARLLRRVTGAGLVVDREVVTRTMPDGPVELDVVGIYEVAAGAIQAAWFRIGPSRPVPSLRPASAADVDAVRALTRAAYARWVPEIGREPLPMIADHAAAIRDHRVDLLSAGGQLVGLIELVQEADAMLIENVAVAPGAQGRGYGRRLLEHAERVAAGSGLRTIRLYTNQRFAANIALYRHVGYRIDREEPFRDGFTTYMSKSVGAA